MSFYPLLFQRSNQGASPHECSRSKLIVSHHRDRKRNRHIPATIITRKALVVRLHRTSMPENYVKEWSFMSILLREQMSKPLTLTAGQRVYVRSNVRSTPTIIAVLPETHQMTQGLSGGGGPAQEYCRSYGSPCADVHGHRRAHLEPLNRQGRQDLRRHEDRVVASISGTWPPR